MPQYHTEVHYKCTVLCWLIQCIFFNVDNVQKISLQEQMNVSLYWDGIIAANIVFSTWNSVLFKTWMRNVEIYSIVQVFGHSETFKLKPFAWAASVQKIKHTKKWIQYKIQSFVSLIQKLVVFLKQTEAIRFCRLSCNFFK